MSECSRWQPSDWCTHGHHSHQPHRAAAWQWLCDKHHAEVSAAIDLAVQQMSLAVEREETA